MGRKTILTDEVKEILLREVSEGAFVKHAAVTAGIIPRSLVFIIHKARDDEKHQHHEFVTELLSKKSKCINTVSKKLYDAAVNGNVTAMRTYLGYADPLLFTAKAVQTAEEEETQEPEVQLPKGIVFSSNIYRKKFMQMLKDGVSVLDAVAEMNDGTYEGYEHVKIQGTGDPEKLKEILSDE